MNWTNVKDKLPEEGDLCLAVNILRCDNRPQEVGKIFVCFYTQNKFQAGINSYNVDYWTLAPQPTLEELREPIYKDKEAKNKHVEECMKLTKEIEIIQSRG